MESQRVGMTDRLIPSLSSTKNKLHWLLCFWTKANSVKLWFHSTLLVPKYKVKKNKESSAQSKVAQRIEAHNLFSYLMVVMVEGLWGNDCVLLILVEKRDLISPLLPLWSHHTFLFFDCFFICSFLHLFQIEIYKASGRELQAHLQ